MCRRCQPCARQLYVRGRGRHRASRVCAAIFREPRLRARCRFCALFVLLFSFATTKMSDSIVIVHSALVSAYFPVTSDFFQVDSVALIALLDAGYAAFCLVNALFMVRFCPWRVVNIGGNCCLWHG